MIIRLLKIDPLEPLDPHINTNKKVLTHRINNIKQKISPTKLGGKSNGK